jgi:hypothetical protein
MGNVSPRTGRRRSISRTLALRRLSAMVACFYCAPNFTASAYDVLHGAPPVP